MKQKYKEKLKKWWLTPNPEGVSMQDAVLVPVTMISIMLILMNLAMWLMKPEQSWIGDLLFPFK